jgi:hypothetical protein
VECTYRDYRITPRPSSKRTAEPNLLPHLRKMHSAIRLILLPLVAFVLYKAVSSIIATYQHATAAKRNGCKPAPTLPSPDPLGIVNVVRLIQSNNRGKLLDLIKGRWEIVSKQEGRPVFTFQTHIVRNWLFATCDPKNIQAILATQFKDFELGPIRFGTFSPLYVHPRISFILDVELTNRL